MSERWREQKRKIRKRERRGAIVGTVLFLLYAAYRSIVLDEDAGQRVFLLFYAAPLAVWWISIAWRWHKERAEAPPPTDTFD